MMTWLPLACDGCFKGAPAVISLVIAVVVLIGSIYALLWSNLGARQAYLVTMVALSAWMILMSAMWMFGAPGTTPGTGPRGREPAWVPFTPDSEQALAFKDILDQFPSGWETINVASPKVYPGKIDSVGELVNVTKQITEAEARLAKKQGTRATKATDWDFLAQEAKPTPGQENLPRATMRFYQQGNTPLLVGAIIPATAKHPRVTVFAYRDKGLVFLTASYFLLASILLFVIHLVLLARYERGAVAKEAALTPEAVAV